MGSWFFLREDKCCSNGCGRQRRFDDLCGLCLAGSNPTERATALLFDSLDAVEPPPVRMVGIKKTEPAELPPHLRFATELLDALIDG